MNWLRDEMDARVGKDVIHELVRNLISFVLLTTDVMITDYFALLN